MSTTETTGIIPDDVKSAFPFIAHPSSGVSTAVATVATLGNRGSAWQRIPENECALPALPARSGSALFTTPPIRPHFGAPRRLRGTVARWPSNWYDAVSHVGSGTC